MAALTQLILSDRTHDRHYILSPCCCQPPAPPSGRHTRHGCAACRRPGCLPTWRWAARSPRCGRRWGGRSCCTWGRCTGPQSRLPTKQWHLKCSITCMLLASLHFGLVASCLSLEHSNNDRTATRVIRVVGCLVGCLQTIVYQRRGHLSCVTQQLLVLYLQRDFPLRRLVAGSSCQALGPGVCKGSGEESGFLGGPSRGGSQFTVCKLTWWQKEQGRAMLPRVSPSSLASSRFSGFPKVASPLQSTQAECTQRPVGLDLAAAFLL